MQQTYKLACISRYHPSGSGAGINYICNHSSQLNSHESFMRRCLQLAELGRGFVAPNPLVGAVLVYNGKIIGEGYHQQYGGPHAEVNCLDSVKDANRKFIPSSVLYVSLEPCVHFGKTPPCTDLILERRIPEVVIGCLDPFSKVNGKGAEKLSQHGVKVQVGVLETDCIETNSRFFTFHKQHRPYVVLKWAQTSNGKISSGTNERLLISNEFSNRLVHRWRSEEASIMVGTQTAMLDDPQLTNRSWNGNSPLRLVIDMNLKLPHNLHLFDNKVSTIIFNSRRHDLPEDWSPGRNQAPITGYYQLTEDVSLVSQVMHALYQMGVQSILVEGGARLLQSFIDEDTWDEARVIINTKLTVEDGLPAPELKDEALVSEERILNDAIRFYQSKRQLINN